MTWVHWDIPFCKDKINKYWADNGGSYDGMWDKIQDWATKYEAKYGQHPEAMEAMNLSLQSMTLAWDELCPPNLHPPMTEDLFNALDEPERDIFSALDGEQTA